MCQYGARRKLCPYLRLFTRIPASIRLVRNHCITRIHAAVGQKYHRLQLGFSQAGCHKQRKLQPSCAFAGQDCRRLLNGICCARSAKRRSTYLNPELAQNIRHSGGHLLHMLRIAAVSLRLAKRCARLQQRIDAL